MKKIDLNKASFIFLKKVNWNYFLIVVIACGVFLRLFNLNWDSGLGYHPDERNIVNSVLNIDFPNNLELGFYAYNGFIIYFIRIIAEILFTITANPGWITDAGSISLISRYVSAISASIAIIIFYFINRKIFSTKLSILATCLFSFNVGFIQHAHFGVTESILVLFILLIVLFSLRFLEKKSIKDWFIVALVSGLAIGAKTSSIAFLLVPLIVWILSFPKGFLLKHIGIGLFFVLIVYLVFFAVSPYSLLNYEKFRGTMLYEGGIVDGSVQVPYTLQFINRNTYLFFIYNLMWHMGFILPVLGLIGVCLFGIEFLLKILSYFNIRIARRGWGFTKKISINTKLVPIFIFSLVYLLYVGGWYAQFIRYTIPLQPFVIIFGIYLLRNSFGFLSGFKTYLPVLISGLLFMISLIWALAFFSIYTKDSTRTQASKWVYENLLTNSVIVNEHWDYNLPVYSANYPQKYFEFLTIKNFDPDSETKLQESSRVLSKGDYLILSSRRLSGTISRAQTIYPKTYNYYDKLFNGDLGYVEIQRFESNPGLFGLSVDSDNAEETFQVFDHPKVIIFKNERKFSEKYLYEILRN